MPIGGPGFTKTETKMEMPIQASRCFVVFSAEPVALIGTNRASFHPASLQPVDDSLPAMAAQSGIFGM